MESRLTWRLAVAATLVNSVHAGGNVNRALQQRGEARDDRKTGQTLTKGGHAGT
jgi:hypothetical protein